MKEHEAVLEVLNLKKKIGKSPIIKDVSFKLDKGEVLGLTAVLFFSKRDVHV